MGYRGRTAADIHGIGLIRVEPCIRITAVTAIGTPIADINSPTARQPRNCLAVIGHGLPMQSGAPRGRPHPQRMEDIS